MVGYGGTLLQDLWRASAIVSLGCLGRDISQSIRLEILVEMAMSRLLAEEYPQSPVQVKNQFKLPSIYSNSESFGFFLMLTFTSSSSGPRRAA